MDIEDFKLIQALAEMWVGQSSIQAATARALAAYIEGDLKRREMERDLSRHAGHPDVERLRAMLQECQGILDSALLDAKRQMLDSVAQLETLVERQEALLASAKARLGL